MSVSSVTPRSSALRSGACHPVRCRLTSCWPRRCSSRSRPSTQQALAHMQRCLGRACGIEKGSHVWRRRQRAHAFGQADDVQRWAQPVQPRPEQAAVWQGSALHSERPPFALQPSPSPHVGHAATGLKLYGGVLLQKRHHVPGRGAGNARWRGSSSVRYGFAHAGSVLGHRRFRDDAFG